MSKDIEVPSIRDSDLKDILSHYGLEGSIIDGQQNCQSCSRTITIKNLGALYVEKGDITLFCDFSECLDFASKFRRR